MSRGSVIDRHREVSGQLIKVVCSHGTRCRWTLLLALVRVKLCHLRSSCPDPRTPIVLSSKRPRLEGLRTHRAAVVVAVCFQPAPRDLISDTLEASRCPLS